MQRFPREAGAGDIKEKSQYSCLILSSGSVWGICKTLASSACLLFQFIPQCSSHNKTYELGSGMSIDLLQKAMTLRN